MKHSATVLLLALAIVSVGTHAQTSPPVGTPGVVSTGSPKTVPATSPNPPSPAPIVASPALPPPSPAPTVASPALSPTELLDSGIVAVAPSAPTATGPVAITADWAVNQDVPLFKKFAVFNSGLLNSSRYNDSIFQSLADVKTPALVMDMYMGTSNPTASFRDVIGGAPNTAATNGIGYDFTELDRVIEGFQSAQTRPYLDYTYCPTPFQNTTIVNETTGQTRCNGFEDDPDHYFCYPLTNGGDDCWKCPPKTAETGYATWQSVSQFIATHYNNINVSTYQQIGNEPDLNDYYYNPGIPVTFFNGNGQDYNDMYNSAAAGMMAGNPFSTLGGPGVAYMVQANTTATPMENPPNGRDLVLGTIEANTTLDFFSFHTVNPCRQSNGTYCSVLDVFADITTEVRNVLSLPEVVAAGRYLTTEMHNTEFFPGVTTDQGFLPFTASPALDILMLNALTALLNQTDVSIVTWAQYMEIDDSSNGTAMIDYDGNARPAWHTFRFWGDLPVERKLATSSQDPVQVVSSFDARTCHGGVLIWNNGSGPADTTVSIANFPFSSYSVQVYQLDDTHLPGPGFEFDPTETFNATGQSATFTYPNNSTSLALPVSGVVYLNISGTGSSCGALPQPPAGRLLKTHYYYPFRPNLTTSYTFFDQSTYSAYLGAGNETSGWNVAGATIIVDPTAEVAVSSNLLDATLPAGGAYGVRVDFWDQKALAFAADAATYFYDTNNTGLSKGAQLPHLWGSEQDVPSGNFVPVDITNFVINPANITNLPAGWDGTMSVLFTTFNAAAGSKVQGYLSESPVTVSAQSTAG